MKNNYVASSILLLVCAFYVWACTNPNDTTNKTETAKSIVAEVAKDTVLHGKYLVEIMGCGDCHSPKMMTAQGPVPDPKRLISGHPAADKLPPFPNPKTTYSGAWALFTPDLTVGVGPWGVNYAANLTPHDTGMGNWTYEQFKKALTQGKSKGLDGGRMLMPPMPWQNYVHMKEDDIQAVFAYLKSIPPVDNIVPQPTPPAM